MRGRVKLLPMLIIAALALLTVKVGALWNGADPFGPTPAVGAEDKTKAKTDAAPAVDASKIDPTDLSPTEIKILENLASRRDQIRTREAELDMREKLLAATEKRIDDKIAELKAVEGRIEGRIKGFDDGEAKRIKSLVRIYEKMKPKEAARIFDRLDLAVVIEVVKRMREAKAAAVLAKMDPGKAKQVTVDLARRRVLPDSLVAAGQGAKP